MRSPAGGLGRKRRGGAPWGEGGGSTVGANATQPPRGAAGGSPAPAVPAWILRRAPARATGSPDSSAPAASARYSRSWLTASRTMTAATGPDRQTPARPHAPSPASQARGAAHRPGGGAPPPGEGVRLLGGRQVQPRHRQPPVLAQLPHQP